MKNIRLSLAEAWPLLSFKYKLWIIQLFFYIVINIPIALVLEMYHVSFPEFYHIPFMLWTLVNYISAFYIILKHRVKIRMYVATKLGVTNHV